MVGTPQILICGEGAGKVRVFVEKRSRIPLRFTLVEEPERLPLVLPRPAPSLVVVLGDLIEDSLFQSWRSRRLADLPLVLIWKSAHRVPDEDLLRGVTIVPEKDLSSLLYLIELACWRNGWLGRTASAKAADEQEEARNFARPVIGRSRGIREVLRNARKVLNVNSSVLIVGESGTGKELIASMVHHESVRLKKPFVKVNCAAIPETLLESELFGIEKNIATNVDKRIGKFELADGGTIFLDEIGDMSLLTQSKVLRILQEREFERVGGTRPIRVRVRVIAATNKDLDREIREKRFREDLYYRLNVITIRIPPLRERVEDIEPLVDYFVEHYCRVNGLSHKKVSKAALELLLRYRWPGNVRELENAIERAVVVGDGGSVRPRDLPVAIREAARSEGSEGSEDSSTFRLRTAEYERNLLVDALEQTGWVQARAARRLGISERSMWHLFKKHGLDAVRKRESGRPRGD
ncbi:MAG: sigma 54-interacting transcriptional regulator [Candidatus Eisenbacteria bacterium]